jgi:hypothetical protein
LSAAGGAFSPTAFRAMSSGFVTMKNSTNRKSSTPSTVRKP